MGRNRVLSFMSQFSAGTKTPPPSSSPPSGSPYGHRKTTSVNEPFPDHRVSNDISRPTTPPSRPDYGTPVSGSPIDTPPRRRSSSRPPSMVLAHQPPIMDITEDTIPELQPIFSFLNSHSNKLYQEGYFLKLDDQNTQGRPNPDRTWTECFAQLVGTVLSLWDAAELDAAGEDGEVLPKFINLTDASIKMIESLPTRSSDEQPLQNILSISTAGRNRYLLHFNSRHSLLQWTAGIRLAIFEHSTMQEAYTGALIAGKGKTLNNIGVIMERSRFKTEEWVRVRFGAGVPWRRCWCVITPPDEKEYAKLQKEMKKRSPYDRSPVPTLKGDIKFYDQRKDGKKQKKAQPIATITDAYSAYAIYPQAKSLIEASTLLKIEGNIAIHTDPPSSTEGFVFIMPETHPAVSGFEMLLRFLFPTWDTFGLYGRPGKLVASVLDSRSLMFAMPKSSRYGYLENLDVSNLILEDGSSNWGEREWRKKLKEATGTRMNAMDDAPTTRSRSNSRKSVRLSFGDGAKQRIGFQDQQGPTRSSRSFSLTERTRTDSAPADPSRVAFGQGGHGRNSSDPNHLAGPPPPRHDLNGNSPYSGSPQRGPTPVGGHYQNQAPAESNGYDNDRGASGSPPLRDLDGMRKMHTPEPVSRPPAFNHGPQARPISKAYHSPELRRANSRLSSSTLAQLATAGGLGGPNDSNPSPREGEVDAARSGPSVPQSHANSVGISANDNRSREALSPPNQDPSSNNIPAPLSLQKQRSRSPLAQSPYGPPSPYARGPNSRPGTSDGKRSPMPPGMGPPRSPHPQNPNRRPEMGPDGRRPSDPRRPGPGPDGRRPSDPRRPGPDGRRPSDLRGPGPDGRRPSDPRARGNGPPPPGHGPPPPGPYGNFRPGPGRSPGPPGPPGPHGPPMQLAHRKPVPERAPTFEAPSFEEPKASTMSTSSVVTANEIIDHYAFDQGRRPGRQGTPNSDRRPPPQRQGSNRSGQSSHYDDSSSVNSIDYASTHKSTETKKSVERPRAGVLKTVGGSDEPEMPRDPGYDIPEINFGPTINYGATQQHSRTPGALTPGSDPAQRPYSPADRGPTPPAHKSSGSQGSHGRKDSEDMKRMMAWQPGASAAPSGSQGLSAEQFVQQRAAHARSASSNTLSGGRPTTPGSSMKRTSSYDMLKGLQGGSGRHSRSSSADLLSRPGSRGANSALSFVSSGDAPTHLSAREQEQVARLTGGPLISVPGHQRQGSQGSAMLGHQRQASSGSGLVAAIEAREREKQQMKQGMSSQAVQHAINQRQQQQAAMAYQQQVTQQHQHQLAQQQMAQQQMAQQQMAQQQMMQQQLAQQQQMAQQQAYQQQAYQQQQMGAAYSTMGQGGGQYGGGGMPYGGPQQAGGYGQSASFSRPLRAQQQVDPRFVPPQGQYGPAPGSQQAPRNVHPQYQGQAF